MKSQILHTVWCFCWGRRVNLKLSTLGSERVKQWMCPRWRGVPKQRFTVLLSSFLTIFAFDSLRTSRVSFACQWGALLLSLSSFASTVSTVAIPRAYRSRVRGEMCPSVHEEFPKQIARFRHATDASCSTGQAVSPYQAPWWVDNWTRVASVAVVGQLKTITSLYVSGSYDGPQSCQPLNQTKFSKRMCSLTTRLNTPPRAELWQASLYTSKRRSLVIINKQQLFGVFQWFLFHSR